MCFFLISEKVDTSSKKMAQTNLVDFLGKGIDTSKFGPHQVSSTGKPRCCVGDRYFSNVRWYAPYEKKIPGMIDSESDISRKVDPLKVAFCQVCVEGIGGGGGCFRMGEVYEVTDPSITSRLSCCIPWTRRYLDIVGNRRCVLAKTRSPDDRTKYLQLNVNIVNESDSEWSSVTVGCSDMDRAASRKGVLRAKLPTFSYWEFVLQGYLGNEQTNDEGARCNYSLNTGYRNLLYCGRSYHRGELRSWPGGSSCASDGTCGPHDGPQCESCMRLQINQPWFKIKSARFKNGECVSVTNVSGNSNFYTPFAGGHLIVNSKSKGSGSRFFFVAPARSAVAASGMGVDGDGSVSSKVADHNGLSNILELEVGIYREEKPKPVPASVVEDCAPVYRSGGVTRGGSGATKGGGVTRGGSGVTRGGSNGLTTGSNFGASGHSEHVKTYATKSKFIEIDNVKFTIQLVNDESDSERIYQSEKVELQKQEWHRQENERIRGEARAIIAREVRVIQDAREKIESIRLKHGFEPIEIPELDCIGSSSFVEQASFLVP